VGGRYGDGRAASEGNWRGFRVGEDRGWLVPESVNNEVVPHGQALKEEAWTSREGD
jgi:hypothetical protein